MLIFNRKREEKEKEVEQLLLEKENLLVDARLKLSDAEQNKHNLGRQESRTQMEIVRDPHNTGSRIDFSFVC
jgi:hypothetical protein